METLLAFLIEWLSANAGIVIDKPPELMLVTQEEMTSKHHIAEYSYTYDVLKYNLTADPKDPMTALKVIPHLVHYYQDINDLNFFCKEHRMLMPLVVLKEYGIKVHGFGKDWISDQMIKTRTECGKGVKI